MKANEYNFEMTLNQPVIEMFKDTLLDYLQIEILQGEVTKLKNGQTRYRLNINEEKEAFIKSMMVEAIKKQNYNAN